MNNKLINTLLFFVVVTIMVMPISVYASELYIHGLYGNIYYPGINKDALSQLSGDAVLLEYVPDNSNKHEYLLMDAFVDVNNNYQHPVEEYLMKRNITEISVYISHYHEDHYGGLFRILANDNIKIKEIYLPKTEYICKYYNIDAHLEEPYFYKHYLTINKLFSKIAEKEATGTKVTFLWPNNKPYENHCFNLNETEYTNKITLGDATIDIIGPLGPLADDKMSRREFTLYDFMQDVMNETGQSEDEVTLASLGNHYANAHSLVSLVKFGNKSFFTAGDINSREEEILVEALENGEINSLKADIMKLSHHGIRNSNTDIIVDKIKPTYTFASFTYVNVNAERFSKIREYGTLYLMGGSGACSFQIKDNQIVPLSTLNYRFLDPNQKNNFILYSQPIDMNDIDDYKKASIKYLSYNKYDGIQKNSLEVINFKLDDEELRYDDREYKDYYENEIGKRISLYYNMTPYISINNYERNKYRYIEASNVLSRINLQTAELFKSNLESDGQIDIIKNNKNIAEIIDDNENVGTGYTIRAFNQENSDIYNDVKISVIGDVNGDGLYKKNDAVLIAKHLINDNTINGSEYLLAADIDNDDKIKMNDVILSLKNGE